jgi:hypothetical protein
VYTFFGGPNNGSFDPGITPGTGITPGSNPNFGRFSGSQGARQIQLALKFLF